MCIRDSPYTLSLVDGKCYLSFKDGQGFPHKLELDVKLYALFDRFELDDLSFLNEQERHLDQTELSEALLSRRVPENQATVEDAVYESLQTQDVYKRQVLESKSFSFVKN